VSEQLNKKKPGQKRVISVNFEHHRFNVVGFDLLVVAKSDRLLDKKKGLFKVKAYLLDPDQLKQPLAGVAQIQSLQIDAEPLENKPFEKLFQIDLINAQRGFSDPNNQSEEAL